MHFYLSIGLRIYVPGSMSLTLNFVNTGKPFKSPYPVKGENVLSFGPSYCHLMQRVNSLEKPLMLGKIEGRRRRGRQRMRWLDGIPDSVNTNLASSRRE